MPLEIALRVPPCAPVPELVALARRMEAGGIDRASFADAVARRVGDPGRDGGGDDPDRALRLRDQSGHPPDVVPSGQCFWADQRVPDLRQQAPRVGNKGTLTSLPIGACACVTSTTCTCGTSLSNRSEQLDTYTGFMNEQESGELTHSSGNSSLSTPTSARAGRRRNNAVRVPKTAEVVAASLRSRIVRGELATGDSLPREPELLAMFNISSPTMREAFRILESERLIEVRRGSRGGARVMSPQSGNAAAQVGLVMQFRGVTIDSVYQARALMESSAISAMRGRPDQTFLEQLQENLREAREILADDSNHHELHVVSREFHSLIVDAAGNGALSIFNDMICDIVDRGGAQFERSRSAEEYAKAQRRAVKSHTKICDLLAEGDLEAADVLWRLHVSEVAINLARANPDGSTVLDLLS